MFCFFSLFSLASFSCSCSCHHSEPATTIKVTTPVATVQAQA
jgi:hypothetical protein